MDIKMISSSGRQQIDRRHPDITIAHLLIYVFCCPLLETIKVILDGLIIHLVIPL